MGQKIVPVILSGGSGTRLWPMSRSLYPKQLLPLTGNDTMLQATARRTSDPNGFAAPIIVTGEDHRFLIADQLKDIGVTPAAIVLEPAARNTAPAIALAAHLIAAEDADALMLVMPSDHVITNVAAFRAAIDALAPAVGAGRLATFGITPTGPETGYGYIKLGVPLQNINKVNDIERFVEKPDRQTAEAYVADGGYAWNSGIFLFKAKAYLSQLETLEPEMFHACTTAMAASKNDGPFVRPEKAAFLSCPSNSIDYAVMEKTDLACVTPVDMGWSDVGAWTALWDLADKDHDNNVLIGDVVSAGTRGSYVRSDGPMVATVGVEDLVVIATSDAVLVTRKGAAQDVKMIVDQLKIAGRSEYQAHTVVHRPWGTYQTTDKGERFQTKRIVVKPGEKLSLQKHFHRAEHWIVVQGTAKVTCDDKVIMVHENESTYIPVGATHRLENPGRIPLHLIEVQSGSYLGEDDIVRFEDTYGRA
jgi:mannose-1-phosphate guanylyltransferase / mannose-6-phosphate isomerase